MKKVLVTGGAGYIGSACVKALCDDGYEVTVADNLSNGRREFTDSRASFFEGDVLDESFLADLFTKQRPEIVIHMAALKAVRESEEQPERYFRNNVTGTLNMLSAAAKHDVERFIFSSTATVYKSSEDGLYEETSPLESQSVYGATKLMAENMIKDFHRTGKIPAYTIFRYFNVAGDAGLQFIEYDPQNLVPLLVERARTDTPIMVYGNDYPTKDGSCIRDYVHVSDIVDAHMKVLEKNVSGIFNLGTSQGTSVLEMVAAFGKITGKKVTFEIRGRRKGDPAVLQAVSTKARNELDWRPTRSLSEMLSSAATRL